MDNDNRKRPSLLLVKNDILHCEICGVDLPVYANFCGRCGHAVRITAEIPVHGINSSAVDTLFLDSVETPTEVPVLTHPTTPFPEKPGPAQDIATGFDQAKATAEGYTSHIRTLIKSSGIYALASLAAPLIALALAPFLTHNLSRVEYGALAVLNTAIALLAGVSQLGLPSALFRAYNYDYESRRDRLDVLSTVIILLSLVSIPIAILTIMAPSCLATFLFGNPSLSDPVRIAGWTLLMQNLSMIGLAWLRAENRALSFSLLSIANLLVALTATIVLVGILHKGISGALMATASGYTLIVFCILPIILLRAGLHLRLDIARGLLTFGVPCVANFVSVWVLQLSDRYLLSRLGSLSQTASYAVAYTLGGALGTVVLAPFTLAWPSAMFAIAKREDAAHVFQLVFRWYSIVLLIAVFALSLVGTFALEHLFPPAYHSAASVIPIVAVSIMFFGIYTIFLTGGSIQRKTWLSFIFTTIAAVINVGLNIVLIPRYGSMGTAASTLIAYFLLALMAYLVNQCIYPIPFEIGLFIIALLGGIALYVGSALLAETQATFGAWGISLGALIFYGGCLVFLGKLLSRRGKYTHQMAREDSIS